MKKQSPVNGTGSFADLDLSREVCARLAKDGYDHPTPIQRAAIPLVLDGADLLACAQTGTGKTAAFALPLIELIEDEGQDRNRNVVRVLVLAPTRELAVQIGDSFTRYGGKQGPRAVVICGGVPKPKQLRELRDRCEVVVATPGRLLDLANDRSVDLSQVEAFVLDEADRMLDMGFVHDVRRIDRLLPQNRQCLLFSATMPNEVRKLATSLLYEPEYIAVDPVSSTCEPIRQGVFHVAKNDKAGLLIELLSNDAVDRALVFTRTKHGANKLTRVLEAAGINAAAIHGNKSQNARQKALADFKSGQTPIIVATDIAARGIDVKELDYVFNFDLPNVPETYVHRIGRTGRAGAVGNALSLCSPDEREYLNDIERLTGVLLEEIEVPEFAAAPQAAVKAQGRRSPSSRHSPRNSSRSPRPNGRARSPGGRRATRH